MLNELIIFFFFQAEDGIRDLVRSRGLGDVYKRQAPTNVLKNALAQTLVRSVTLIERCVNFVCFQFGLSLIHI